MSLGEIKSETTANKPKVLTSQASSLLSAQSLHLVSFLFFFFLLNSASKPFVFSFFQHTFTRLMS